MRYDNEKRSTSSLVDPNARQSYIDLNFDGVFNDPINPALSSLINPDGVIPDKQETFSETQPKVSFRWDATDSTAIFGSWGVGFKAGGFNNAGSAATVNIFNNSFINCGNPLGICYADDMGVPMPVIADDYDKETSSAFELGFHSTLAGGRLRLNGAAYYTEVTDMQFFEFYVGSFGLLRVVSNMDKVEITGLELGADFVLNDNWRFYAGGNWLDSEIKANSSRPDTVGNKAPYTPDYTFNFSADMNYPITDRLNLLGRVDVRLVGDTWFHSVEGGARPTIFMPLFEMGFGPGAGALGTANYDVARRDAFGIIDLRLGVGSNNWTVTAFASNLTDEHYLEEVIPAIEFGGNFDHPGAERRYGLEVSFRY